MLTGFFLHFLLLHLSTLRRIQVGCLSDRDIQSKLLFPTDFLLFCFFETELHTASACIYITEAGFDLPPSTSQVLEVQIGTPLPDLPIEFYKDLLIYYTYLCLPARYVHHVSGWQDDLLSNSRGAFCCVNCV